MKKINVTALRQNLPAYVARAQHGERIKLTSRGTVIAELGPPTPSVEAVKAARRRLHGSVRRYDDPLAPVIDPSEWEANA